MNVTHKFNDHEGGYCRCKLNEGWFPRGEDIKGPCHYYIQEMLERSLIKRKITIENDTGTIKGLELVKNILFGETEKIIGKDKRKNYELLHERAIVLDYYQKLVQLSGQLLRLDERYFVFDYSEKAFYRVVLIIKEKIRSKIRLGMVTRIGSTLTLSFEGKSVKSKGDEELISIVDCKVASEEWEILNEF